jgi:hypothetical protein
MAGIIKFVFHDGQELVVSRNMIVVLQPKSGG